MPEIIKRSFTALKFPKGSTPRNYYNETPEFSEYMPSYKYVVRTSKENCRTFKTKREAEDYALNH